MAYGIWPIYQTERRHFGCWLRSGVIGPQNFRNFFWPRSLILSNLLFKPLKRTLLADSTWPFVWGCSIEVNTCFILSFEHILPNCWLGNWVMLSDTRCLRIPKWHTMFFHTMLYLVSSYLCNWLNFSPLGVVFNGHNEILHLTFRQQEKV